MASSARDNKKAKKVITIASKADFDKTIAEAGNKHILVEFFATWCGPCAIIGPHLEQMATEYEDCLLVLKIDVDDNEELAEQYDVNSMPSFVIIKDKVTLEQFAGSNAEKVQTTLQKFCGKPDQRKSALPGPSVKPAEAKPPAKIMSLLKTVTPPILKPSKSGDKK
ncbi:thioredoxin-2 [Drosophila nasuta]|uniref:Thioredoxin-2 n=1 Tax=Drosophila albomicans TaxID=7291 RepID=A0A6P8WVF0_DROAB|nr:thioredoxin-2 [Drosophila albomicans]XP_060654819.1 thioredoxin-2 [Drosophila nasuta]